MVLENLNRFRFFEINIYAKEITNVTRDNQLSVIITFSTVRITTCSTKGKSIPNVAKSIRDNHLG